ncbi:MAG TPA: DUF4426 domain-containing protein [Psychromonas hadalis]|nr:DUF4426 domain-containing protein [Psychromonas hadalis]
MFKLKPFYLLLVLIFTFISQSTYAEQAKEFGDLQVHYIALPSTFLQPNIAKQYNLKRSKYMGLVNISVLSKIRDLKAQKAVLTGTGKNLIGQTVKLSFQEIVEGDSIYYIATYPFTNEEIVKFQVNIKTGSKEDSKTNVLKFQHKFYVD